MTGMDGLLASPRYEVFPGRGTEQAVADWVPAAMTVTVTASPVKGLDATIELTERLAARGRILLLCGRYEGFDERIRLVLEPEEISIGDFVTNGGEVAAMVIIDAVIRLVPGVLGDAESSQADSFSGSQRLLEFAQYTRPRVFRGLEVPAVLLGGDHGEIARWRQEDSRQRTRKRRADLLLERQA